MSKGLLLDFEAIAHRADGDPQPLLREIRNLGYEVYRREFLAACEYVMYIDLAQHGYDSAEKFLEAVFKLLDLKPKRTELMSLAPVFVELHAHALYEDVLRALPELAKGRKVAVLASLPAFLVAPVLAPIKAHLAAVVTPKEAKTCPPNPKVYETALVSLKLKAKEVAVVAAHCPDLAAAKPLGVRTVLVRREGEATCPHADFAISSFDELAAALKPTKPEVVAPAPG
ncbi:MAG: HAD hydrolase-like protein [Euryarchaeota archaeon]|nr:HAD hydrolase-like protein [Euryarchaeota archaeon]